MNQIMLPPEWKIVKLGDVCEKAKQVDPTRRPHEPFTYIDVSSVSNNSFRVVETKEILGADAPSRARKQVQTNDVIFATVRPTLKRVAMIPASLDGQICSTGFCVVRAIREYLDASFAYFYLLAEETTKWVELLQKGVAYPAISDSELLSKPIPLPPLPEQRAIARVLRAVQKVRELRQKQLALERQLKAALMQHLFTRGAAVNGVEQRKTRFGKVPARWKEKALSECAFVQTGVAKGRKLGESRTVTVPYLRVANVQDGYLDLSEIKQISIRESEVNRYQLHQGDVVLTEGGDFDKLGRGFVWNGELPNCVHQNHVFAVRVNREALRPEFLAYLAQSSYGKSYFLSVAHKTTNLACINTAKLKAFPALIPELDEQRQIVQVLETCDAKIAMLEKEADLLDELFRALLEKLMTGRLSAAPLME